MRKEYHQNTSEYGGRWLERKKERKYKKNQSCDRETEVPAAMLELQIGELRTLVDQVVEKR